MLKAAIFLTPWEFSPAVLALCVGAVAFYARGLARMSATERPGVGRRIAFFVGWGLVYFVMQTHYDCFSRHVFFIHRIQHLVLHHLGPSLVVLAQPLTVLARGLPRRGRDHNHRPSVASSAHPRRVPVSAESRGGAGALRRTDLPVADPGGSFRRHAERPVLRRDELENAARRAALLVAGARSADEGRRGAHRPRRAHLGGAARDPSADRVRSDRTRAGPGSGTGALGGGVSVTWESSSSSPAPRTAAG